GQILEVDATGIQPLLPRTSRSKFALDLVVLDEATFCRVDQEHFAGAKASLANDTARFDVENADLARQHDKTVVGDEKATGAKTVAVQRCADHAAVGEDKCGRAIPRLHEHRVVLVERAQIGSDVYLVL